MISKLLYFCIYVTLLSINIEGSYSLCGNWQTYRDDKCIKIFSTEKFVTFDDALKSCSQMDNSSQILTIHSKEEQEFLTEYLFQTQKLMDNIWIGLSNRTKIFEWTDSSTTLYTNWKKEYPTNIPDYNCVQLDPESLKWINVPCHRRGLVVCEKLPDITNLFKQIHQIEEDLKEKKGSINKTEETLKKLEEDLRVTKDSLKKSEVHFNETNNKIFNIVYKNNKNVSQYHFFTDINGKNKAFIIPLDGMKKQTFDNSINLCKSFNSTLIEIESKEKQLILESFLSRLGNEFLENEFRNFWLNGRRDSSFVWKWLSSNTTFTFTNWKYNYPHFIPDVDMSIDIVFIDTSSESFGKWFSQSPHTQYVMCEHSLGF